MLMWPVVFLSVAFFKHQVPLSSLIFDRVCPPWPAAAAATCWTLWQAARPGGRGSAWARCRPGSGGSRVPAPPGWVWAAPRGSGGCFAWREPRLRAAGAKASLGTGFLFPLFLYSYVEIVLTLIKGVCLACLPLSCLPIRPGCQIWSREAWRPLDSRESMLLESRWKVSAFLSAILQANSMRMTIPVWNGFT